ncbi:hypothetical protein N7495_007028 [Penicillium taxi]|uniref:uncharacterized protein n=1 Tax=Penicillium taxi TaxID=168475 RepID=UPI002544E7EC|nr:uncharacterized protein N7495_007028 [Penicillium taxi]KAJ5895337.1 hypothetical protein N7495_007028 [Penicillium taxi]
MGVDKKILSPGNGTSFPKPGDYVDMHYTGCLYDASQADNHFMGKKFDSSYDRKKPLGSAIGVGRLIKGWDEGVPTMSLGEKAILTITPDYAYGPRGIPGVIPENAVLVFEVSLEKITPQ